MKGAGNQPSFQSHLELHAALLSTAQAELGTTILPRQAVNAYIMQAAGVGIRQSVNRYLEAWEDLRLIAPGWNAKGTSKAPKTIKLLPRPAGLGGEFSQTLEELVSRFPRAA